MRIFLLSTLHICIPTHIYMIQKPRRLFRTSVMLTAKQIRYLKAIADNEFLSLATVIRRIIFQEMKRNPDPLKTEESNVHVEEK